MGVRKIFIVLITVVVCVILGAFVLNVLMPNMVATLINAVEGTIYSATGMSFDFNGDGQHGAANNAASGQDQNAAVTGTDDQNWVNQGAQVDGYK